MSSRSRSALLPDAPPIAESMRMTSAEFARFVKSEIEDSARIAHTAGIKAR